MIPLVRPLVACVVLAASLACDAAAAPSPASDAAVRQAIERVYGASTYQRDLPDAGKLPPPPPPRQLDGDLNIGGSSVVTLILAGALVIIVVMIAMRLLGGGGLWPKPATGPDKAAGSAAANTQRVEIIARLDDADQAAADGDWARAIHILLLTSIDRLRRQTGQGVPVALTARELIHHLKLGDAARGDLTALVGAAELCHFGGRSADRELYERVRTHYERLWDIAPPAAA